jgi:hypothetical protein
MGWGGMTVIRSMHQEGSDQQKGRNRTPEQGQFDEHKKCNQSQESEEHENRDGDANAAVTGRYFEAPAAIWLWSGSVFRNRQLAI